MSKLWVILFLAMGGAAGTLARVGLTGWVNHLHGSPWPWGTFAVNALGCFLFGFIWSLADSRFDLGDAARLAILGGFCGAFTTFSTFAFDSHALADKHGLYWAASHILAQNVAGIALVFVGLWLGRVATGPGAAV